MTSFKWRLRWQINTPKGIKSNMLFTIRKEDAKDAKRQAARGVMQEREEEIY
jgi:hypothetical protein